jgi:hypothetical protein
MIYCKRYRTTSRAGHYTTGTSVMICKWVSKSDTDLSGYDAKKREK